MSVRLTIELTQDSFPPGAPVHGYLTVDGGSGIRRLKVWLAFVEWSNDYAGTARTESERTLADGPVPDGQRIPFELILPADAAPEVRSNHGGLAWEVLVKADVRGPDALEGARISVAPSRS